VNSKLVVKVKFDSDFGIFREVETEISYDYKDKYTAPSYVRDAIKMIQGIIDTNKKTGEENG